jgi:hypothetical protein
MTGEISPEALTFVFTDLEVLGCVYEEFSEGFGVPDLVESSRRPSRAGRSARVRYLARAF